jgi:hypothetical protein
MLKRRIHEITRINANPARSVLMAFLFECD